MPNIVNYRMRAQDDLSVRTDFTFDVMDETKIELQDLIDQIPEVQDLRNRAMVDARFRGSLTAVEIDLTITPSPGTEMTEEQLQEERSKIFKSIHDRFSPEIGAVLQRAIDRARARM